MPMNENFTAIGQVILLVTTLAGFGIQLYRENRNRRWDLEDRKLARIGLTNDLEKSSTKAAEERKVIADDVKSQIKENTEISTKAFEEANSVNRKILDLEKGTRSVNQRIEDLIRVFDSTENPTGKPMEPTSVVINTEHVTVDKKLSNAKQ